MTEAPRKANIQVSSALRDRLRALKVGGEDYEATLRRILAEWESQKA